VRRDIVKRRVGPALYEAMEPGDQIMAGALAMTGPSPAWEMLLTLPALAGSVAGAAGLFSNFSPPQPLGPVLVFVPFLFAWPLQFRRKPVFVAVTQRQFISYGMSRFGHEPSRLLFSAPLAAVRVTNLGGRMSVWGSVKYYGPGVDGRSLRLNGSRRWRKDLNEVVVALQAGGAAVDGMPPSRPHCCRDSQSAQTHPRNRPQVPQKRVSG
jgi:hypothetical protein